MPYYLAYAKKMCWCYFFPICSITSDIELLKSSKQTKQVTVKTVRLLFMNSLNQLF